MGNSHKQRGYTTAKLSNVLIPTVYLFAGTTGVKPGGSTAQAGSGASVPNE
jgi:hypothetical protein